MNHDEAKRKFKHALENQQSISIPKLKNIMTALNITLEPSENKEVAYLKGEIEQLARKYRNLKRRKERE
ncbi:hypothetical protein J14TS2_17490 [Bacillus sp. J14TS2]|uniref:hypothetical protein n=1 Tax=Bacillus sp. J14TS2 TaxID=2807188 RepID=UPI001B264678|nr:hypothetical protein [Bacillus sp. J14TS2]GIN71274.1 hypothetical protein J14TS2_17490 [Bacillus sp. J14TS2]